MPFCENLCLGPSNKVSTANFLFVQCFGENNSCMFDQSLLHPFDGSNRNATAPLVSETLHGTIWLLFKFQLQVILIDAFSSTLLLACQPLVSLSMITVLFDLKRSVKSVLMACLIPCMALASLFSRALRVFLNHLWIASSNRCQNGSTPFCWIRFSNGNRNSAGSVRSILVLFSANHLSLVSIHVRFTRSYSVYPSGFSPVLHFFAYWLFWEVFKRKRNFVKL